MTKHIRISRNGLRAAGAIVGLAGLTFGNASAQEAGGQGAAWVDPSAIDGVVSVEVLDDGSVRVTFENGRSAVIDAGSVQVVAGQVLVDAAALAAASEDVYILGYLADHPVLAGALLAGGAGAAALALWDDGESNAPPAFSSAGTATVSENTSGTVYTATATDPNANDQLTFSIVGGADAGLFSIDASTGAISFLTPPDFEAPADAGADNTYDLVIAVSDGQESVTQTLTITVTNQNDNAPVILSEPAGVAAEGGLATSFTMVAEDADGDALTYAISGGPDAALFTIDPATGVLSFIAGQDFEAPADADGNGQYQVVVSASDGQTVVTQSVRITLTDTNDTAPVFVSGQLVSVDENSVSTGYAAVATDADTVGGPIAYSLGSSGDSALFTIDAATGALSFISAPDFEAPGDADADNEYEVEIIASDGVNATSQTVRVTVNDLNTEFSPVFTSASSVSVDEDTSGPFHTFTATDGDGQVPTFSITGGADAAAFNINPVTGALEFMAAPDFEAPGDADADNVYEVTVTANDGTGRTTDQTFTVTVQNVNEAPVINGNFITFSDDENGPIRSTFPNISDPDGDALTYSITGGADAAALVIDPVTGQLSFATPSGTADFEAPLDADGNNVYEVEVTATDGTLSATQTLSIGVTDVNEPVVFASGASASVDENQTSTGYVAAATDPEGVTVTYSIAGGADASQFTIDPATGVLSFVGAPDFDAPGDSDNDNVYEVIISGTDGNAPVNQAVSITVNDVNDQAPVFASATASAAIAENTVATGYAASAVNTDTVGGPVTYALGASGDSALFTIDAATGALSFIGAPDFEAPGDADADNVYVVEVVASDGSGLTSSQTVSVTVTNENDNLPAFVSGTAVAVDENETVTGYAAAATDADGDTVTYALGAAGDTALFTIDAATGALSFISAPDFEAPGDANADNVYEVEIIASAGGDAITQTVTVTVNDLINEFAPVFTSAASTNVDENTSGPIHTFTATDGDGQVPTFSITGGADAAAFNINPVTGALEFMAAPDFEAPGDADADNVYEVTVTADDGNGRTTDQTFTVAVQDVNDVAPFPTQIPPTTIAENNTVVGQYISVDADGPAPITYSISGGNDAALFNIDPLTGVLSFISAPDFENPLDSNSDNDYIVEISITDGTNTATGSAVVSVTDVNEAPAFSFTSVNYFYDENQTNAFPVGAAADPDGDTVTYSISGGPDAALFTIDPATGFISFITAPDFEAPADANGDNVYIINIEASDGSLTDTLQVLVNVTDVNEAPVILSVPAGGFDENQTFVGTLVAQDPEGGALTITLGGPDAGLFTVDSATGVISLLAPEDFENPNGASANGGYAVTYTVSDGVNSVSNVLAFVVQDVDESPVFTSGAAFSVDENQTSTGYIATATDPEGVAITFSIAGGADAALFTIDASTGALSFAAAQDFENPLDSDADNVYEVVIEASDGTTAAASQAVSIAVSDVNEAPSFASANPANLFIFEITESPSDFPFYTNASDPDGDTLIYSIVGGADAAEFEIDPTTGVLSLTNGRIFDFEAPTDSNADNAYELEIQVSDGALFSAAKTITINVMDQAEGGSFTSSATQAVNENLSGAAFTVTAVNAASTFPPFYTIVGGVDRGLFTIDTATGVVSFVTAPDFENPADAGQDNIYNITVAAQFGSEVAVQEIEIQVLNLADPSSVSSPIPVAFPDAFSPLSGIFSGDVAADDSALDGMAFAAVATDFTGLLSSGYAEPLRDLIGARTQDAGGDAAGLAPTVVGAEVLSLDEVVDLSSDSTAASLDVLGDLSLDFGEAFIAAPSTGEPSPAFEPVEPDLADASSASLDEAWSHTAEPDFLGV
ncbi:MAG: cadherin repeat domain-containing protein [Alphaproteobacteria bacterium]|nr:cadherin repeat domain-containing protein [Alphaproteobacteria bacterium]